MEPGVDGETVFVLEPNVDLGNVDEVRRDMRHALAQPDTERFVIDLHQVTFMDSLGLGLLIDARNRCEALGLELVLRDSPAMAKRLLSIAALDKLFTFDPA